MKPLGKNTALLLIDVQKGLDNPALGERNNPAAESNIAALLAQWRAAQKPIIHIRHDSSDPASLLRPELPGNAFKPEALPLSGEKIIAKSVNSAFVGTELEQYLQQQDISSLVIVGLTTDHCVSSSTRMAANLGFDVTLVSDATAAFERLGYDGKRYSGDEIHRINLVSLQDEFCDLCSSAELLNFRFPATP